MIDEDSDAVPYFAALGYWEVLGCVMPVNQCRCKSLSAVWSEATSSHFEAG